MWCVVLAAKFPASYSKVRQQGQGAHQIVVGVNAISIESGIAGVGAIACLATLRMVLNSEAGAAIRLAAGLAILAVVLALRWGVGVGPWIDPRCGGRGPTW